MNIQMRRTAEGKPVIKKTDQYKRWEGGTLRVSQLRDSDPQEQRWKGGTLRVSDLTSLKQLRWEPGFGADVLNFGDTYLDTPPLVGLLPGNDKLEVFYDPPIIGEGKDHNTEDMKPIKPKTDVPPDDGSDK